MINHDYSSHILYMHSIFWFYKRYIFYVLWILIVYPLSHVNRLEHIAFYAI